MSMQEQVTAKFQELIGSAPQQVVRAPGRVNLIGEHTDYNDGFVLPMAIDRAVWIALTPRDDQKVVVYLMDFDDKRVEFALDQLEKGKAGPEEYLKGVAWALQDSGLALHGWEGVLKGDVPVAAGLSSSAAIELAAARAFTSVADLAWDAPQMALLSQKAENQWVGMNCGIMDQMISAAGREGHALLIDCRSLETELAPLPPDTAVVVLDTNTRRELVGSAYNERREQCEAAARHFGVPALRDVTVAAFEARQGELEDVIRRRARHIVTENDRTLQARDAMRAGDAETLGQLMNASHASLRDDFEVSSDALNAIVECAQAHDACYGARMTGAGFGGCAVALVKADAANDFGSYVTDCYIKKMDLSPQIYITLPSNGAEIVAKS